MRFSINYTLLFWFLTTCAITSSLSNPTPTEPTPAIHRFRNKGGIYFDESLTPAQRYARDLSRRAPAPTRRYTAKRRQVSPSSAPTLAVVNIGATNQNTGYYVGYADITWRGVELGPEKSDNSSSEFVIHYSPMWGSIAEQTVGFHLTIDGYYILGLVQRPGDSLTLGKGLASAVKLAGVENWVTPGSAPSSQWKNQVSGNQDLGFETNVWTIDYYAGTMTPVWVNSDGSRVQLTVITDGGVDILATGDLDAFNAQNNGDWFAVKLAFSIPPTL